MKQITKFPRQALGFFPTPFVELKGLSAELKGPRIFIKRDDQTGLALGGSKTRKLEFLVGEALARGCDTLVTGGAQQSNHCRQTAAAAAACGLACHLVLGGKAPTSPEGNLLLDILFDATIHWSGAHRKGEDIPALVDNLIAEGKKPYVIPYGGSNEIGALAFVEAYRELRAQLQEGELAAKAIIFASSSGGTQAGLCVAKELFEDQVDLIGINIDKGEAGDLPFHAYVLNLTNSTARMLELEHAFTQSEILLRDEFTGDGYGVVGAAEREAVSCLARCEGILLDPVYTGRAMAGLLAMVRASEFRRDDIVVFWHTGGTPALFPYAQD
ncbi:MAG: D-cysteine desulfhydrase family protein, partial [Bdellovibrionales bacterium]|nr:D-cysteine desulfhydrase family protein [Bdellovibrionales bacterium]